jgi:DNA-binding CsgD family transcriptional regulator
MRAATSFANMPVRGWREMREPRGVRAMMGRNMLQGAYLSVMEARTRTEFRERVIRFCRARGFDTVTAMLVVDQSPTQTEFHVVHNAPEGYMAVLDSRELAGVDPVMQHCKRATVPIIWDQDTYISHGLGAKWETQAAYGFKTGIALAMHLSGNRHFCIGVDREKSLPICPKELTRIVADMQLFAVHAQEAAQRIFASLSPDDAYLPLTPRELEALRWTMDGKLAWEIGDVLNISERTAVFHLQNATRKLQCKSKFQAVLKAIRLGLLS